MSRLRLILGAGACSIALSGCIPAVAGLALTAANMVTGGGGANNANGFRNPIDRQSTGRQVKEALSRLDDRVDPACQATLDEIQNAKGGAPEDAKQAAGESNAGSEPRNLLAKVESDADVARSAETVPAAAAEPAVAHAAGDHGEAKPVKTALAPAATAAPGQCEHRLVCLPGTPKPTLMLMCPGRGGGKDGKATVAGETPGQPTAEAAEATGAAATAGQLRETAVTEAAAVPEPVRASAPAVPAAAPSLAPERGVADWNWAYDPAKQL